MDKPRRYTLFFISWLVLIAFLSLYSFPEREPQVEIPYLDKAAHFGLYAVGTCLGCLFLRERTKGNMAISRAMAIIVFAMLAYGIIIEVIQWKYTTWRSGEVADALANALGTLLGGMGIRIVYSGKGPLKWKN